jgi:hypothetical protein
MSTDSIPDPVDLIRDRAYVEFPLTMALMEGITEAIIALTPDLSLNDTDATIAKCLAEAATNARGLLRVALTAYERALYPSPHAFSARIVLCPKCQNPILGNQPRLVSGMRLVHLRCAIVASVRAAPAEKLCPSESCLNLHACREAGRCTQRIQAVD